MAYVYCDLTHRRRTDLENVVVTPVESLVLEVVLRQENGSLYVCIVRAILQRSSAVIPSVPFFFI